MVVLKILHDLPMVHVTVTMKFRTQTVAKLVGAFKLCDIPSSEACAMVCWSSVLCICLLFLLLSFLWLAVFPLITRRKFTQIDVLEGLNVLIGINGRKNKLRVYYLSWLKQKILKGDDVRNLTLCAAKLCAEM